MEGEEQASACLLLSKTYARLCTWVYVCVCVCVWLGEYSISQTVSKLFCFQTVDSIHYMLYLLYTIRDCNRLIIAPIHQVNTSLSNHVNCTEGMKSTA